MRSCVQAEGLWPVFLFQYKAYSFIFDAKTPIINEALRVV